LPGKKKNINKYWQSITMDFNFWGIPEMTVMKYVIFGNTVFNYLLALIVFLVVLAVMRIFKYVVIHKLKKIAQKTKTDFDDMIIEAIEKVFKKPFYAFVSVYAALKYLTLSQTLDMILHYILILVGTYYGIKFVSTFVDYGTRKFMEKGKEGQKIDASALKLMNSIAKAFLWLMAALLILSNLGYNINTLIAGLGVGGIAVAFALQNILADVFASFSIHFDKPFETGDFIEIGTDGGTVKRIGIKSTRITTVKGDELVISNRELTESRVHNYKKMEKRRITFHIGVEYGTPSEKLKKIPKIITEIISKIELLEMERVHFKEFGDSDLKFEIVYYINSNDYKVYMDKQQEINLKIKEAFDKEKIAFAFPTQTIFMGK